MRAGTAHALWTIDSASGEIFDWNAGAAELCGWNDPTESHSFHELSRWLSIDKAGRIERLTLARLRALAASIRRSDPLPVRLRLPSAGTRPMLLTAFNAGVRRTDAGFLVIDLMPLPVPSGDSERGALAALVGHELNNITVPLQGFTEFAMQHARANTPVRQCLEELSVGIDRIKALASELDSLGEADSTMALVSIGDCIRAASQDIGVDWRVDWACGESTLVSVDPLHAQWAIASLVRIAAGADSQGVAASLTVTREIPAAAHCGTCGVPLGRKDRWVALRMPDLRPVNIQVLRDPIGSERAGRATRRLALAVFGHCAHGAGGHVLLDEESGSLTLVLAAA